MFFFLSLSFSLSLALGRIREYLRSKEIVGLRFGRLALFCLVVRICSVWCLVLYCLLFCMQDVHTHGLTFTLKNHIPDNYPNRYKTIIICIFYMPHISHAIYLICLINISCVLCFFISNIISHGVWMGINSVDMRYTPLHFF